jgi:hypothetical protein
MEQPPQSAVAFGRTATASFPGGDFLARANSRDARFDELDKIVEELKRKEKSDGREKI